jgi:hypothetical protein
VLSVSAHANAAENNTERTVQQTSSRHPRKVEKIMEPILLSDIVKTLSQPPRQVNTASILTALLKKDGIIPCSRVHGRCIGDDSVQIKNEPYHGQTSIL